MEFGQLFAANNTLAFLNSDKIHHATERGMEELHTRQRKAGISVYQGAVSLQ